QREVVVLLEAVDRVIPFVPKHIVQICDFDKRLPLDLALWHRNLDLRKLSLTQHVRESAGGLRPWNRNVGSAGYRNGYRDLDFEDPGKYLYGWFGGSNTPHV